jgi:transglutaminase-like putative cysteine protease
MRNIPIGIILLLAIVFSAGCCGLNDFISQMQNISTDTGGEGPATVSGNVINMANAPVQNVHILIIGNSSNYSGLTDVNGNYSISGVPPGVYDIFAWKEGYRGDNYTNMTIIGGDANSWGGDIYNFYISRDCIYSPVYTSNSYVLKYGNNVTVYRGEVELIDSYPEGATYDIYPADDGRLSEVSVAYVAGNRMLRWKLNNSEKASSPIEGHFYVYMNGTGTLQLYYPRNISIQDAASMQPNYLGSETDKNGRTLIDTSNPEIMAIAQQVKGETKSNDTWTVARAMFIWLKNNTVYYIDPETSKPRPPIETLHIGKGKCDELSNLYVSLLRAAGIPSRYVTGYKIEKDPDEYVGHRWVEFFDGEWVSVEVAGQGWRLEADADMNFGVHDPEFVATFMDDGTNESMTGSYEVTEGGYYYDRPSEFASDIYYNATGHDQVYIAACADGTRELAKQME